MTFRPQWPLDQLPWFIGSPPLGLYQLICSTARRSAKSAIMGRQVASRSEVNHGLFITGVLGKVYQRWANRARMTLRAQEE